MEKQLAGIDLQAVELRKLRDDKLSAILVQQQTEQLKDWASQYLANLAAGLRILELNITDLSEDEFINLYQFLGASRFEEKDSGDTLAAFKQAVLEEKRKTVRMLIDRVLVVKDTAGSKSIVPQLAFELPDGFASLVYDDPSLEYIESWRKSDVEIPAD